MVKWKSPAALELGGVMFSRSVPIQVLVAVLVCGACGGEPAPRQEVATHGPSVMTIHIEGRSLAQLPLWRLEPPSLVIGTASGSPNYLLNRAGLPWVLSNGSVVVPNNQSEIRWYDSTGAHIRTVGRRGQGPGEFVQLMSVYPLAGDSIVAADAGMRRVSVFDIAGRFLRSYAAPAASYPVGLNWLGHGKMVFHRNVRLKQATADRDTGVLLDSVFVVRASLGDATYDTLARMQGWRGYFPRPGSYQDLKFAGVPLMSAGPGGIVMAHGDEFTLHWFDSSGKPTRISRVSLPPIPVPPSMIKAYESELEQSRAKIALGGEVPPPQAPAVHAQYLPAIVRVVLGRTGHVWVRRWAADDAEHAEWIVFDSSGAAVARVAAPAGLLFADAGDGYILGRYTDEDGVQSVRRYRVTS